MYNEVLIKREILVKLMKTSFGLKDLMRRYRELLESYGIVHSLRVGTFTRFTSDGDLVVFNARKPSV